MHRISIQSAASSPLMDGGNENGEKKQEYVTPQGWFDGHNGHSGQNSMMNGNWSYDMKTDSINMMYRKWKEEHYDKECVRIENSIKEIIGFGHNAPCDVSEWTAQQVSMWLRNLGLGSYDADFEYESINGEKLLKMHVSDIKEIMSKKADVDYFRKKLHDLKKLVCFSFVHQKIFI